MYLLHISSCQAFSLRQHVAINTLPEGFTTLVYSSCKSFMSFQQLYIILGKGHLSLENICMLIAILMLNDT